MIYLIDGTNVCHWGKNKDTDPLNLTILLNLLIELRTRRQDFFCFFDASTRHNFRSQDERAFYLRLISDYAWCFTEITGKIRADDFILLEADSTDNVIISNDQFKEYANDYPWLKSAPDRRLVKGALAGDSLMLAALKIRRKLDRNLSSLSQTLAEMLAQWKSETETAFTIPGDQGTTPLEITQHSPEPPPLKTPDFTSFNPSHAKPVEPLKPPPLPPLKREPRLTLKKPDTDPPPKPASPPKVEAPVQPPTTVVRKLPVRPPTIGAQKPPVRPPAIVAQEPPAEAKTWFPVKLIRRLDREIRQQWPQRKGWVLVDASEYKEPPIWVHIRPYLRGSEAASSQHGYRVEPAESATFHLPSAEDDYVVVFVRSFGQPIADAAQSLLWAAQQQLLAWLTIELRDRPAGGQLSAAAEVAVFRRDGNSQPLTKEEAPLAAKEIEATLIGDVQRRVKRFLPFEVKLSSGAASALFTVQMPESNGFSRKSYHFVLSGRPSIGQGTVRVDVRLRAGHPDEVILRGVGFASPVGIDVWETPPGGEMDESIGEEPLVLHVLYDRTSIDAEFWMTALATFDNVAQSHMGRDAAALGLSVPAAVPPPKWNQHVRQNLAGALTETLPELHPNLTVDLWWFADVERSGIVRPDRVPATKSPAGPVGNFDPVQLADKLLGQPFNYASGMDWFDAVDDGLSQIVESIQPSQEDGQQHVVLIVGDSPPPPKDQTDVIWRQLVDQPWRTNARRSPKFQDALQELRRMKAPVCWLFLRATTSPPEDTAFPDYLSLFSTFQTLNKRALDALKQVEKQEGGLFVEGCSGAKEDMSRGLRRLFLRLRSGSGQFPLIRILKD